MISVVMPVYNEEKYLKETIDSILNQTYTDFEFIIVNDGSTDRTDEIILSYKDKRIVYLKNETNLQIVKTLNKGIKCAKGKYIARMDADDISLPERFEKQTAFMESNPEIGVCGTWVQIFGDNKITRTRKYPTASNEIKMALMFYSPIVHPSVFIRKSLFDKYAYTEDYEKAEDYYLWYQVKNNFNFANLPQVLLKHRLHGEQTSTLFSNPQLSLSKQIRIMGINDLGIEPTGNEITIHEAVSMCQTVDLQDAEAWMEKLYNKNLEADFFDSFAFKEFIDETWWQIVNANSKGGLSTFLYYLKSKKFEYRKENKLQVFKLFVKCLIKYKA